MKFLKHLLFALALSWFTAVSARAVTNTVTSAADSGAGTLRYLVTNTPAGGTINFTSTLSGQVITLTSGQITLSNNVTIDGSALASPIQLNGNHANRVFFITNATVTLNSLVITNGFSDVDNDARTDIPSNRGGGIYSFGNLTVNGCTFAGNHCSHGGGGINIYAGTLVVSNSTFYKNDAGYAGGAIINFAPMTVDQSTIVSNTGGFAGGLMIWSDIPANNAVINQCTIVANVGSGGGIYAFEGSAIVSNSIVVFNLDSPNGTQDNFSASPPFSIVQGGVNYTNTAPQLGPLGNNGGPTLTMLPQPGSPVIDGCTNGAPPFATDQRGYQRLVGAYADIGAVEADYTPVVLNKNDSGVGSLRQAVAQADSGATITFTNTLSGQTILLTNGQIILSNNVTIDGSGLASPVQLNGNHTNRIFNVNSGVTVALNSLIFTNGWLNTVEGGNGVVNYGTLTMSNCSVIGNGNPNSYGGGGLWNQGVSMTLNNCTLAGNASTYGGGIENESGTLTVNNSTLANNTGSYGGGIDNKGGLTVNNCTLANNSVGVAGGGIENENGATLNLTNSIVCNNTATSGSSNIFGSYSAANNLVDADAQLAPLGNYAGPTQTMPPSPGSPAIDAGSDGVTSFLATDQRGFPRKVGAHVDIGAVEVGTAIPGYNYTLVTAANDFLSEFTNNGVSLRTAVSYAATNSTITFDPSLSGDTIFLLAELEITNSVTIDASTLAGGMTIDGDQIGATLRIQYPSVVTLKSLTITGGSLSGIAMSTIVSLYDCTLTGNQSSGDGGGLYAYNTTVAMTRCVISGNSAITGDGGGVALFGSDGHFTNCTFTGNSAGSDGGGLGIGVASSGGTGSAFVTACTFSGNTAVTNVGGGICHNGVNLVVRNSTFFNNSCGNSGGAILNYSPMTVDQCTIVSNTGKFGGGIMVWAGNPAANTVINQCTITGNFVTNGGGGVFAFQGSANVTNSIVALNTIIGSSGYDNFEFNTTSPGFYVYQGGVNYTNSNPLLAPLNSYGGPTMTTPPLAGSPAIDGCTNGAPAFATDQRGYPRVVGAHADIGAVELQSVPASLTVVTTNSDDVNGFDVGGVSLREAVLYAPSNGTITFATNLSGQTISLTNGQIVLSQNVTINGSMLSSPVQLNGNQTSRIFYVNSGVTVTNNFLVITNGFDSSGQGGGGIYSNGRLTMNNCAIAGNVTTYTGGGIFIDGFTLPPAPTGAFTLNNSTLANNSTLGYDGGGIHYVGPGTIDINECTFTGNSCGSSGGGAIDADTGGITINQCTISGNTNAAYYGAGGVYCSKYGSLSIHNSIVAGNSGQDIFSGGGPVTLTGVNLANTPPLLAPLGNYGGPTMTMPPLPGSPAIDACTNGTAFTTDQRGFPRIAGPYADIGAVEGRVIIAAPPQLESPARLAGGFQFGLTNFSGACLQILASTNVTLPLTNWTFVGYATESPLNSGQFHFSDPQAANYSRRFYRAVGQTAIESGLPSMLGATMRQGNGSVQFGFTNLSEASFTVLASTDLTLPFSAWTALGPAVETPPGSGQFQFTDPGATNYPQRFYRVSSP